MDRQELEHNKEQVTPAPKNKQAPQPLSRRQLTEELEGRMERITEEFRRGFEVMMEHPRSVTFFGSARLMPDHTYYKKAKEIAKRIVEDLGYDVITGGGPGVMEAGNWGAHGAEGDGESLGFNIKLPMEQELNEYVHESVSFYYFFARKVLLAFAAEAYLFFPGGFGTLDEFFEIVTLVQTGKIQNVPIICIGEDYWGRLDEYIRTTLEEDYRTISGGDRDIYTITENVDKIIDIIKKAPVREE